MNRAFLTGKKVYLRGLEEDDLEYIQNSAKIFLKLGFSKEGRLKDDHFRNGRYYDIVRFGLINKKNK